MTAPTLATPTAFVMFSGHRDIDALLGDVQWRTNDGGGLALSFSFPWRSGNATFSGADSSGYSILDEPGATYRFALNSVEQKAVRAALQAWSDVANVTFVEVADTAADVGDIRVAWSSVSYYQDDWGEPWGWSYFPDGEWPCGGDVWISSLNQDTAGSSWLPGSYNFNALLHEFGHSLGLKHPFDGTTVLENARDNGLYTVMSYVDTPNNIFPSAGTVNGVHDWITYRVDPETPMVLDIAAIQYLYGANTTFRAGDDVYAFDAAVPFFKTLWDAGGVDTLSAENFALPCVLDLAPGGYSSLQIAPATDTWGEWPTYDGTNNLGIAYGCIIENAIGGSGSDVLYGNAVRNVLWGNVGDDFLDGGDGIDTAGFTGLRAGYVLSRTPSGWGVGAVGGSEGVDSLINIERLQFADMNVALDLAETGAAGQAMAFIGVIAPSLLDNLSVRGTIIGLFDEGYSIEPLCQLALDLQLIPCATNSQLATATYQNVIGAAPAPETVDALAVYIEDHGQAGFLAAVAGLHINVDLVGWQQVGIEYLQG